MTDMLPATIGPHGSSLSSHDVLGDGGASPDRRARVVPEPVARRYAIGFTLVAAAAVFSEFGLISALLAGGGVIATSGAIRAGLRRPAGLAAAGLIVFWIAYAAAIGSLPSPSRPADVLSFLQAEGRALIPPALFIAALGVPSRRTAQLSLDWMAYLLSVTAPLALLLSVATGLGVGSKGVFHAFASSHHVPGFIYGLGAVVLLVRRRPLSGPWRVASVVSMAAVVVMSGSRASLVGLMLVGLYFVLNDLRPAVIVRRATAVVVCLVCLLGFSPRASSTVSDFLSEDFTARLSDAFDSGASGTQQLSTSQANVVKRFGLFGLAIEQVQRSPLLGIGVFRFNDSERVYTGEPGLVHVAIDGDATFNDHQAHNMYLHLMAETGIVGTLLYLWPLLVVLRCTRRKAVDPERDSGRTVIRCAIAFSAGVGVASAGLLTAGLGFVAFPVLGLAAVVYGDSGAAVSAHASEVSLA